MRATRWNSVSKGEETDTDSEGSVKGRGSKAAEGRELILDIRLRVNKYKEALLK